jgi:hypothetical protein
LEREALKLKHNPQKQLKLKLKHNQLKANKQRPFKVKLRNPNLKMPQELSVFLVI